MNLRISAALFTASFALLGCSTPAPEQTAQIPPPEISRTLPPETAPPPDPDAPMVRACKLGESCMELDPRPFEACLVGTKHCTEKVVEPLLVETPKSPSEAGVVETRYEGDN